MRRGCAPNPVIWNHWRRTATPQPKLKDLDISCARQTPLHPPGDSPGHPRSRQPRGIHDEITEGGASWRCIGRCSDEQTRGSGFQLNRSCWADLDFLESPATNCDLPAADLRFVRSLMQIRLRESDWRLSDRASEVAKRPKTMPTTCPKSRDIRRAPGWRLVQSEP